MRLPLAEPADTEVEQVDKKRKKDCTKSMFKFTGLHSGTRMQSKQGKNTEGQGMQTGHYQTAGQNMSNRYQAENQEQVQMAGMQVHNIDNMTDWQRGRAGELVMYTDGLVR